MLSNVTNILKVVCFQQWLQRRQLDEYFWSGLNGSLFCITTALTNTAHWMFSYEYFNMVRIIPFVLDDTIPPESILKSNKAQFWIWMVLNMVVSFLGGVAYFNFCVNHISWDHDSDLIIFTILFICLSILDTISVFYLGISIIHIRKLIKEKELLVNTKIMIVHAATFVLYLSSIMVFCITA